MAVLGVDNFIRADQAGWGTAPNGATWTPTGPGTISISSNKGVIVSTGNDTHVQLGSQVAENMEVRSLIAINVGNDICGIQGRFTAASGTTTYKLVWFTGTININKSSDGSITNLASTNFVMTPDIFYWFHLRVVKSVVLGRIWEVGTAEPDNWMLSATDSSITGSAGFAVLASTDGASTGVRFAYFSALDPIWTNTDLATTSAFSCSEETQPSETLVGISQVAISALGSFLAQESLSFSQIMQQEGLLLALLSESVQFQHSLASAWLNQISVTSIGTLLRWLMIQENIASTLLVEHQTRPFDSLSGGSVHFSQSLSSFEASEEVNAQLATALQLLVTSGLTPLTIGHLMRWLIAQESIADAYSALVQAFLLDELTGVASFAGLDEYAATASGTVSSLQSMVRAFQEVSSLSPVGLLTLLLGYHNEEQLTTVASSERNQLFFTLLQHVVRAQAGYLHAFERLNQESVSSLSGRTTEHRPISPVTPTTSMERLLSWSPTLENSIQDILLGSLVASFQFPALAVQTAPTWSAVTLTSLLLQLSQTIQYERSMSRELSLPLSDLFMPSSVLERLYSLPVVEEISYQQELLRLNALSIVEQIRLTASPIPTNLISLDQLFMVAHTPIPIEALAALALPLFDLQSASLESYVISSLFLPAQVQRAENSLPLSQSILYMREFAPVEIYPALAQLLTTQQREYINELMLSDLFIPASGLLPVNVLPLSQTISYERAMLREMIAPASSRLVVITVASWLDVLAVMALLEMLNTPYVAPPPFFVRMRGRDGVVFAGGRDGIIRVRGRDDIVEGRGR